MSVFVTREPVFDRGKNVLGYHLLFRSGFAAYCDTLEHGKPPDDDGSAAEGAACPDFAELTGGKTGFVTFPRHLLTRPLPESLPRHMLAIDIQKGTQLDQELRAVCERLKDAGSLLVIDGDALAHDGQELLDMADIVKVDFRATPAYARQEIRERLATATTTTMAENLDTQEEFQHAVSYGCTCFHGAFFRKPIIRPEKKIPANKAVQLQVLNEVNRPELALDELEALIKQDVSMTYRLLRFMNSVWFGLRYEVRSIRHALVLLGPKEMRKWASMVIVRSAGADKPRELLVRSLARARLAELAAPLSGLSEHTSSLFLTGMFSCIDAMLDVPLAAALEDVALHQDIKSALLGAAGPFRTVLDAILSYEEGDWAGFEAHAQALHLEPDAMPGLFFRSLKWANGTLDVS
jgi:EAL and modified HD-GYP domain-containing signal transduction protein